MFVCKKLHSDGMKNSVFSVNSLWWPLILGVKTMALWTYQIAPLVYHSSAVREELVQVGDEGAILLCGGEDGARGGRGRTRLMSSNTANNCTCRLARASNVCGWEALSHWGCACSWCNSGSSPTEHLNQFLTERSAIIIGISEAPRHLQLWVLIWNMLFGLGMRTDLRGVQLIQNLLFGARIGASGERYRVLGRQEKVIAPLELLQHELDALVYLGLQGLIVNFKEVHLVPDLSTNLSLSRTLRRFWDKRYVVKSIKFWNVPFLPSK